MKAVASLYWTRTRPVVSCFRNIVPRIRTRALLSSIFRFRIVGYLEKRPTAVGQSIFPNYAPRAAPLALRFLKRIFFFAGPCRRELTRLSNAKQFRGKQVNFSPERSILFLFFLPNHVMSLLHEIEELGLTMMSF